MATGKQIGALAVIVVLAVLAGVLLRPHPPVPHWVDSLGRVNAGLVRQNDSLVVVNAAIDRQRIQLQKTRDSLRRVSAAQTAAIIALRDSLIPVDLVPDSLLRETLRVVTHQLDDAIRELGRKDRIIAADSVRLALGALLEGNLRTELGNAHVALGNEQRQTAYWRARAAPACGRRCGMIIGAAGMVGLVYLVRSIFP